MNADNPQSWVLPAEVLVSIATLLEPTHRGVVRHVSRDCRVAARAVAEAGEGDGLAKKRSFRLRASSLCGSLDLVKWGRGAQGCLWSLKQWMEKAAGEMNVPSELLNKGTDTAEGKLRYCREPARTYYIRVTYICVLGKSSFKPSRTGALHLFRCVLQVLCILINITTNICVERVVICPLFGN